MDLAANVSSIKDTDGSEFFAKKGAMLVNSEEWRVLEYMLQLHARSSRVKLRQAWKVAQPHLVIQFERKCMGRMLLHSYVDTSTLEEGNSIQEVFRRGIQIPKKGMKFTVGNFSFPGFPLMNKFESENITGAFEGKVGNDGNRITNSEQALDAATSQLLIGERRLHNLFLCQIGVGKSMVLQDEEYASGERFTLPPEFDSVFIKNSSYNEGNLTFSFPQDSGYSRDAAGENDGKQCFGLETVAAMGVLPRHTFNHTYILYSGSQVLPRYLLQVECDPTYKESFAVPLCDNCQDAPSEVWCGADCARLCKDCDLQLHSHNKLVSRHVRSSLSEMPRPNGKCKYHPLNECSTFCLACQIPVCRLCKTYHAHTDIIDKTCGLKAQVSNALVSINEAFKAEHLKSNVLHKIFHGRKVNLRKQADIVDALLSDVRANFHKVEAGCYGIIEKATKELQEITEEKMCMILGDQVAAKAQMDQIMWCESSMDYLRSVLPPADFLASWLCNCRVRDEMHSLAVGKAKRSSKVYADIQLEGAVHLLSETAAKHYHERSTHD